MTLFAAYDSKTGYLDIVTDAGNRFSENIGKDTRENRKILKSKNPYISDVNIANLETFFKAINVLLPVHIFVNDDVYGSNVLRNTVRNAIHWTQEGPYSDDDIIFYDMYTYGYSRNVNMPGLFRELSDNVFMDSGANYPLGMYSAQYLMDMHEAITTGHAPMFESFDLGPFLKEPAPTKENPITTALSMFDTTGMELVKETTKKIGDVTTTTRVYRPKKSKVNETDIIIDEDCVLPIDEEDKDK